MFLFLAAAEEMYISDIGQLKKKKNVEICIAIICCLRMFCLSPRFFLNRSFDFIACVFTSESLMYF